MEVNWKVPSILGSLRQVQDVVFGIANVVARCEMTWLGRYSRLDVAVELEVESSEILQIVSTPAAYQFGALTYEVHTRIPRQS